MDDGLPLDGVVRKIGGIDEGFEQVDRRNADNRGREFDFEYPRIDVR